MDQKTPLYEWHRSHGGKMVEYAGYSLPVQYTGVIDEHMAVREKAGLFDVSHMGEFILSGADALKNLNYIFTNDFTHLADGRVRYSPMCNEIGGIVDDMIIYRFSENKYMIVPNAANKRKDFEFMQNHIFGDALLEDISDNVAQLALQGPNSKEILASLSNKDELPQKYYSFKEDADIAGLRCLVSRTGYTGEFGYEIYCRPEDAERLWTALMEAGEKSGLMPCGLGARDTLRLEAAMPLYGHEMTDDISPLETGLDFAVKLQKDDFIGSRAIKEKAPVRRRVGLKITGRGIAREHNPVYIGEELIGETTSGTHCPYLKGAYAMALVKSDKAEPGTAVQVEVRGRRIDAEIVPLPFLSN